MQNRKETTILPSNRRESEFTNHKTKNPDERSICPNVSPQNQKRNRMVKIEIQDSDNASRD